MRTIFSFENEFVTVEEILIKKIPCLKFKPKGIQEERLPTILYYHGWHSGKVYQRFKGTVLASYGYQVIVPDAIYHGERDPIDHDDPNMLEAYFWKVILQNVQESEQLIAGIIEEHQGDPRRMAVIGSSMGGFSASGIFVQNKNLKCLINFNGSCAWVKAEEIFRRKSKRLSMTPEEMQELSPYDPMLNKENLQLRPILMLHGNRDSSVPINSQRLFYQSASYHYKECPERLRLVEIQNMDHYISTGMMEEAIIWLKKYL
ncbi:prolyl oligopeptidase family serine peptidase [Geosporobacter ferrireducens]|uniref:Peptidase S9 prolyl oligopeptidase catalytic domain-containing protein n=1 Tax=Geosporobacter ferrireducens TaxID=1424294 RepID=A0A1D8GIN4_9FIRM|nr:prolyl oligopeptidase family serine peptidase [Geosporobacter ferrireducens]AOT70760.1 hypothetical protein Gferi_14960 [Geosporobacter ferrireducens]MTI57248.1 hypothetical protein [Geosporobacter ferrireducens]